MSANTATWVWLMLHLIYLLSFISFHSIISFLIPPAHDMKFWGLKMLILLKFHLFISWPLDFFFYVLFSSCSNSCKFLKFHESVFNMMKICLLWASATRILLWELYSMLNFGVLDVFYDIGKLGSIHAIKPSNLDFKIVTLMLSGSSHFHLSLHLSLQNVCKFELRKTQTVVPNFWK